MATAIIGTGNIGGTLARHLVRGGEPAGRDAARSYIHRLRTSRRCQPENVSGRTNNDCRAAPPRKRLAAARKTRLEGAVTIVLVCRDAAARRIGGRYFEDCNEAAVLNGTGKVKSMALGGIMAEVWWT